MSCGLCVPLFVFIFLYFIFRSPFKRWSRYKIQEYKHKQRNSQYPRHKRSKIKGDIDTQYKNTDTKHRNPQSTRHQGFYFSSLVSCVLWVPLFVFIFLYFVSRSPFILDLLCLVDCGFLSFCLSSCILYLYHLLF
jgi:hypothetical protein